MYHTGVYRNEVLRSDSCHGFPQVFGLVPSHQIGRLAEARFFVVDTSFFRALILTRQKA